MAAAVAAAYLLVAPFSDDLAAHAFRADLFGREGWALWDNQWYGGHHVPGYSTLFPPLAWALGPQLVGALAAVVATGLFAALVHRRWGRDATVGAAYFAVLGPASLLLSGRLTFALGLAVGLGSLLALQRDRRVAALLLAAGTRSPPRSPRSSLLLPGAPSRSRAQTERRGSASGRPPSRPYSPSPCSSPRAAVSPSPSRPFGR